MGTIAKWLVLGVAAAAQADCGASSKSERFALRVQDFEVAFDTDIAIIVDGDFCGGHPVSEPRNASAKQNLSRTSGKVRIGAAELAA